MRVESAVRCEPEAMRLVDLQPKFLAIQLSNANRIETDAFEQAQGIMFLCPKCFAKHGVQAHSIVCWFIGRDVSDGEIPEGQRWAVVGSGYDDLTLTGIVAIQGGCHWCGRLRHGRIRSL